MNVVCQYYFLNLGLIPRPLSHTHECVCTHTFCSLAAIDTVVIFLIIKLTPCCESARGSVTPVPASITFPKSSFPWQLRHPTAIVTYLHSLLLCAQPVFNLQSLVGSGQVSKFKPAWTGMWPQCNGRKSPCDIGNYLIQMWVIYNHVALRYSRCSYAKCTDMIRFIVESMYTCVNVFCFISE